MQYLCLTYNYYVIFKTRLEFVFYLKYGKKENVYRSQQQLMYIFNKTSNKILLLNYTTLNMPYYTFNRANARTLSQGPNTISPIFFALNISNTELQ